MKAHKALNYFISYILNKNLPGKEDTEKILAYKEIIENVLPPLPRMTMADVEWEDSKHFLAEAEDENGNKVIMFAQDDDKYIRCMQAVGTTRIIVEITKKYLVPTGKRYMPQEEKNDE